VLVPAAAGVLSALGLATTEQRRDSVRSYVVPLAQAGELPAEGEADLRYRGQSFELSVPLGPRLEERFHRAHEERYGYAEPGRGVELVAVRTAEVSAAADVDVDVDVHQHNQIRGPGVLELPGSTVWVPPGWSGETDASGTLVLRR
jgi:N-methylhydantoinase A